MEQKLQNFKQRENNWTSNTRYYWTDPAEMYPENKTEKIVESAIAFYKIVKYFRTLFGTPFSGPFLGQITVYISILFFVWT